MNYLAHLYLADNDPDSRIGSLMGDFVKGPITESLPGQMRKAILQHRRIDSFTDQHPIVQQSKRRISPRFRRYAPILIDMFFDHFLAVHWDDYASQSLESFSGSVYNALESRQTALPPNMQKPMYYLVHYDLLLSYRSLRGIEQALRGIEGRLKRPSRLGEAIRELQDNLEPLYQDFTHFFPLLIQFSAIDQNPGP